MQQEEKKTLSDERLKLMAEVISKNVSTLSAVSFTTFSNDSLCYKICRKLRIRSFPKQMRKFEKMWNYNVSCIKNIVEDLWQNKQLKENVKKEKIFIEYPDPNNNKMSIKSSDSTTNS